MSPTGMTFLPARVLVSSKTWRMVALKVRQTGFWMLVGEIGEGEGSLRDLR